MPRPEDAYARITGTVPCGEVRMKAFLAGAAAAILIAVAAGKVSNTIDLRSRDIYQSPNGSVRLSSE
jgi:hypothetical protein